MSAPVRIAVAIATRERPSGLARLLSALAALRAPNEAEVLLVVVDNDPAGSARAVVEATPLPWPVRYQIEPRPGVSHARNRALAVACDVDAIAFVDDDETVGPDWLVALVKPWRQTGAAAVTGPVRAVFAQEVPDWIRTAFPLTHVLPPAGGPLQEFTTGNVLLDRRVLDRHGLRFDEALAEVGGEDTVLAIDLVRSGERIVWAADAETLETVPASRARLGWLLRRWYRTGNIQAIVGCRRRGPLPGRVYGLLGGLARIGVGLAALPLTLPAAVSGQRGSAVRRAYTLARGLGMVATVMGHSHREYRVVHGS